MKRVFRGVTIEIDTTGSAHIARATVPTKYGPLFVQVQAPRVFMRDLAHLFPELTAGGMVASGSFFDDMTKGFDKLMKDKTFGQVTSIVSQVAENPLLQGAATALGGPAGLAAMQGAAGAAKAAQSLAARARKGDATALQGMRQISQRAKGGDPKAKRAVKLIKEAVRLDRQAAPSAPPALQIPAATVPMGVPLDMGAYEAAMAQYRPETFVQMPDGSVMPEISSGCMGGPAYGPNGMRLRGYAPPAPMGAPPEASLYAQGPGQLQYVMPVYQSAPPPQAPPLYYV